jgi:DNA-binding MarR family transcriptional regulator
VTRLCDRLERKGLIARQRPRADRRAVLVSLTDSGRRLVTAVSRRRRRDVTAILAKMSPTARRGLVPALRAFAEAAGEAPEQAWSLGWGT